MNVPTLACAAGFDLRLYFSFAQSSLTLCFAMAALSNPSFAVTKANLDESRIPSYVLPDPLIAADGTRITTADQWTAKRRPEILRLFEMEVYGRAPAQTLLHVRGAPKKPGFEGDRAPAIDTKVVTFPETDLSLAEIYEGLR